MRKSVSRAVSLIKKRKYQWEEQCRTTGQPVTAWWQLLILGSINWGWGWGSGGTKPENLTFLRDSSPDPIQHTSASLSSRGHQEVTLHTCLSCSHSHPVSTSFLTLNSLFSDSVPGHSCLYLSFWLLTLQYPSRALAQPSLANSLCFMLPLK